MVGSGASGPEASHRATLGFVFVFVTIIVIVIVIFIIIAIIIASHRVTLGFVLLPVFVFVIVIISSKPEGNTRVTLYIDIIILDLSLL